MAEQQEEDAELITEENPRIKFALTRSGTFALTAEQTSSEIAALCALLARVEASGAAPVLNDGKVGGNCAICESLATAATTTSSSGGGGGNGEAAAPAPSSSSSTALLVSRSGKSAGVALTPGDFVRVRAFDRKSWGAEFESRDADTRPSSDTPLLWACLSPGACEQYGWHERPRVALHGHALATGKGGACVCVCLWEVSVVLQ
jgi:hypothetical protein